MFVYKVPKTSVVGILCKVSLSWSIPQAIVIDDPVSLGLVSLLGLADKPTL